MDGTPIGSGGGEVNTASNIGATGVGVFYQKVGVDLQFKTVTSGSNLIYVQDDSSNHQIAIDVRNDLPEWNANALQGNSIASGVPVDGQILRWNSGSSQWGYDYEMAGPGIKRGIVDNTSFSGSPYRYSVSFATSYSGTSYSVTATPVCSGSASYLISIEDKTDYGFIINTGSNDIINLVEVDWQTISI